MLVYIETNATGLTNECADVCKHFSVQVTSQDFERVLSFIKNSRYAYLPQSINLGPYILHIEILTMKLKRNKSPEKCRTMRVNMERDEVCTR